ncbi:MAG: c-type cytochrome [Hyphomicrobiales bacterium]
MLSGKPFKIVIAGAMVLGLGASLAHASPDDSIRARQTFMKSRAEALGPLVAIMKGEATYDPAAVKASLDTINAAWEAAKGADPFAPDSAKGDKVETWAKPEVWSDPEGFKAASEADEKAMAALAASTDEASFKAAFTALGNACGGCHEKFRRPKE